MTRSHAERGNARPDAPRPVPRGGATQSVATCVPTRSVGTRETEETRPMTEPLLPGITSPADLHRLNDGELLQLAQEIRDELVRVLTSRPAHFASNLGVVELCLALHLTFDFSKDRLIWDTGHQIYPHKLITGRFDRFHTMRTRGGLMGFPNPHESDYDLPKLRKILRDLKTQKGPILLHVFTNKGHGVPQAAEDPVTYHTPPVFERVGPNGEIVAFKKGGSKGYTDAVSFAIHQAMQD